MSNGSKSNVTIYYDYLCPYVYRAAEWIHLLEETEPDQLEANWRFFSLKQVNHRLRDGWQIWDQPAQDADWESQESARSLRFFWAAEAARRQGDAAFKRFHLNLLRAIHAEKREMDDWDAVQTVAIESELNMGHFQQDIGDSTALERLAEDHQAGAAQNVFGTPTFDFPDADPAYIKIAQVLNEQEARELWHSFQTMVVGQPYVKEIKRPQ